MEKEYIIDDEFMAVMSDLSKEEEDILRQSLLTDGYKGAPIFVWKGKDIIIDGHNRYRICKEYGIQYQVKELEFSSKEAVITWMLHAQLGRRNLNSIQRIALAEKFRPQLEAEAKKRQGSRTDLKRNNGVTNNLVETLPPSSETANGNLVETLPPSAEAFGRTSIADFK